MSLSALLQITDIRWMSRRDSYVPATDMTLDPADFALSQFEILAVDSGSV
jgi:hypothetical protein